jgi:hypothetical protein
MARKKGHWQSERCTVCSHPKIGTINFSLARGISPLAVAKQHGLGTSAVYNHNRAHVEENYRKIIGSGVYADIAYVRARPRSVCGGCMATASGFAPIPGNRGCCARGPG